MFGRPKTTKKLEAHFYVDSSGEKCDRDELLEENRDGWYVVQFYIGGGFNPLVVAVGTCSARGFHQPDVSGAAGTLREWLEKSSRFDELEESEEGGYELPEELFWEVLTEDTE
ncbi:MAG: hypothetical protein GTO63_33790 [Anaerolineae bacterium]|nr:hypothetical protein [Anaerolineae bacterium]NIN99608.1 hypothetical protein [Anaerolineae bacterium]NIQ82468.1 hypothetical protein [Anaerolineae bacterium]